MENFYDFIETARSENSDFAAPTTEKFAAVIEANPDAAPELILTLLARLEYLTGELMAIAAQQNALSAQTLKTVSLLRPQP